MANRNSFNNMFLMESLQEDDRRLVLSSLPVFFLFSLILASFLSPDFSGLFYLADQSLGMEQDAKKSKTYSVLVEQKELLDVRSDQIRALSDVNSEGQGGITTAYGFHTLTPHDRLTMGRNSESMLRKHEEPDQKKKKDDPADDRESIERSRERAVSASMPGEKSPVEGSEDAFRIPANYRFRSDFSLRYNGDGPVTLARQQIAGFRYFQNMLRYLRDNFAPPGMNFVRRDSAGIVISQSIKPQTVKVLFLLGRDGRVHDVRVVSSMGQKVVDQACIDILNGHNFGPPPPEIFAEGNIFGINFIFPPVY